MAKVIIPVGLDTKEVRQNTKSVKDMLKSLGGASKEAGDQLESAFAKGNAKTAKLITDLQKANVEVQKQALAVSDLKTKIDELQAGKATVKSTQISGLTRELKETEKSAEKVAQKMDKISIEAERLRQTSISVDGTSYVANPQKYDELTAELDRLGIEYQKLTDKASATKGRLQEAFGTATQSEIAKTNVQLQTASARLDAAKAKARSIGETLKKSSKSGTSGIEKFNSRVIGLAKRVFIFSVITRALRALKNLFAQSAQGSDKFKGAVAGLQKNLWAIYSVLYQYVMPVIIKVTQLISRLAQNVLTLLSKILGKSTSQLLANGNALKKQTQGLNKTGKAAKKAKGQLAAFDEVNQMSKDSDEDASNGGVSFDAGAISQNVQNVLDAILLVVGGAMFVIGLLLACTGHIGLGIGLMIGGIAILAAQIAAIDWKKMPNSIKTTLTYITAIAGVALLAIGCILISCPTHLPLAIGCIIAGVLLLVAAVALNWDYLKEKLQGTLGIIMAVVGTALLVIGIILCATGVALSLGLALIIAGAGSLVAVVAANWDAIVNAVKSVWGKITDFWDKYIAKIFTKEFWANLMGKIGNGIKSGAKAVLNGLIWLVNKAIDGLNFILTPIRGIIYGVSKAFGKKVSFDDIKIPHIPKLAKGGVIYQPTIAQIGEYSGARSNPEIVSPENKLREIFSEGNEVTNDLLRQLISAVQKSPIVVSVDSREIARANRTGESLLGKQYVRGDYANAY